MIKINFSESSTWRGLFMALTGAAGVFSSTFTPEYFHSVVNTGLLLVGTMGIFIPDKIRSAITDACKEDSKDEHSQN